MVPSGLWNVLTGLSIFYSFEVPLKMMQCSYRKSFEGGQNHSNDFKNSVQLPFFILQ